MAQQERERGPAAPSGAVAWAAMGLGAVALAASLIVYKKASDLDLKVNARLGETDQRIAGLVQKVDQAAKARPPQQQGPDPNKVYTVKTEGAPSRGPATAPVTIAEFSDYQWPFCARVGPTLKQIEQVYGDKVRIVWKHHPLPFHNNATPAAIASMAAHAQGKFWEYHDKLFLDTKKLESADLTRYAKEIGLDMKKFEADVAASIGKAQIEADTAEAMALGATGTPAFFVNGRFLNGAKPFAEFAKVINAELQRLNLPIPPGAS